ncbi:polysaccharide deacetylase family protein [Amycolatopsis anabasis]|uniref:polysaccharide deacetylase family protein n=1 Tax=Amycolatopsis anabasis TaxID=1840409 RepID=UPI00131D6C6B|nr:polysaccharide deacetylase family protein [Amycolatopsis anabasis]
MTRQTFRAAWKRFAPFQYLAAALVALIVGGLFLSRSPAPAPVPVDEVARDTDNGGGAAPPAPEPAKLVSKVQTNDKVVFLTIDDGMVRDPAFTGLLRDHGVRAQFFLTNSYVTKDAEYFRGLRRDTNSAIGNHTLDHPDLRHKPIEFQRQQICGTSDSFEKDFGKRPELLRPPYGHYDDNTLKAAGECGIKYVVNWTAEVNKGKIAFQGKQNLVPGDIVLMHFRKQFGEDLAAFLDQAKRDGLTPALLADYLK